MRVCLLTTQDLDADPFPSDDWPCDPRPFLPEAQWEVETLSKRTSVEAVTRLVQGGEFDLFFNLCDGAADQDIPGIEVVETLGEVLSSKVGERVSRALNQTGGEKSAAAVLNAMSKEERKKLLDSMDERAPDLVRSIRMKMFTFDDLQTLDVKTIQKIMREVDASKLAVALSAATDTLKEAMLGSLSKRAAENVREEIDNMGKISLREVEVNQNSIIDVVRQLETEGEISLEGE